MRDVADKPALRGYQRFDPLRHVIKITAEVRDLIVLNHGRLSHASGKISVSQLPCCFTELSDGCGYLARQPEANNPRDQKDSRDAENLACRCGFQKIGDWMSTSLQEEDVTLSTRPGGTLGQYSTFS